jgi:alpha-methylacyl-CoA racemase
VTPVATLDEAMNDRQFVARDMVRTRSDGSFDYAPPFKLSGHEFAVTRQAPMQGEHGAEVLREAGFDAASIDALIAAGVVRVS